MEVAMEVLDEVDSWIVEVVVRFIVNIMLRAAFDVAELVAFGKKAVIDVVETGNKRDVLLTCDVLNSDGRAAELKVEDK